MTTNISLIDTFCKYYQSPVYKKIKNAAWGENSINIASMLTMHQLNNFAQWADLKPNSRFLDLCCGVGEITQYFMQKTKANAFGLDINSKAIQAAKNNIYADSLPTFIQADVKHALPFEENYFDFILFVESIVYFNHAERMSILKECHRILKPQGKLIYTDPCIISHIIGDSELAMRAIFGGYYFSPIGVQENMFNAAGFDLVKSMDITEKNSEAISNKWWMARERYKQELQALENQDEFDCIHRFIEMYNELYSNKDNKRKLSQYAFFLIKQ